MTVVHLDGTPDPTASKDRQVRSRRAIRRGIVALFIVMSIAVGWWAGRATLQSSIDDESHTELTTTASVTEQTVGRSVTVTVTLLQPVEPLAVNLLAGVVTGANQSGVRNQGDELYSVAGRSVRAIVGAVPFYRDLDGGAVGADVRQLEDALVAFGFLAGADDRFTSATRSALKSWQAAIGMPATGRVALGELVAVPQLPAELRLGEDVRRGGLLSGGEAAVFGRVGSQDFQVVLSEDQERLIPADAVFHVTFGSSEWDAVVAEQSVDETGNLVLHLSSPDGGPVCGDECTTLPADERLSLRAAAIVIPEVTGPTLPAAAIRTRVDGTTFVILDDGAEVDVELIASNGGLAVVEGVDVGAVVVLPRIE